MRSVCQCVTERSVPGIDPKYSALAPRSADEFELLALEVKSSPTSLDVTLDADCDAILELRLSEPDPPTLAEFEGLKAVKKDPSARN